MIGPEDTYSTTHHHINMLFDLSHRGFKLLLWVHMRNSNFFSTLPFDVAPFAHYHYVTRVRHHSTARCPFKYVSRDRICGSVCTSVCQPPEVRTVLCISSRVTLFSRNSFIPLWLCIIFILIFIHLYRTYHILPTGWSSYVIAITVWYCHFFTYIFEDSTCYENISQYVSFCFEYL